MTGLGYSVLAFTAIGFVLLYFANLERKVK